MRKKMIITFMTILCQWLFFPTMTQGAAPLINPTWDTATFSVYNPGWRRFMYLDARYTKVYAGTTSTNITWQALKVGKNASGDSIYILSSTSNPQLLLAQDGVSYLKIQEVTEDTILSVDKLPGTVKWTIDMVNATGYGAVPAMIRNVDSNRYIAIPSSGSYARVTDWTKDEAIAFDYNLVGLGSYNQNADVNFINVAISESPQTIDLGSSFTIKGTVQSNIVSNVELHAEVETESGTVKTPLATLNLDAKNNTPYSVTIDTKDYNLFPEKNYSIKIVAEKALLKGSTSTTVRTNKDTTAPTGTGKLQIFNQNDTQAISSEKDYTKYLTEYSDNVTEKSKLSVVLKPDQNLSAIVGTVGPSSLIITITDEAGNKKDVEVPVFIKDVKTNVDPNSSYAIRASDFSIRTTDYPKTEALLDTTIRTKSGLKLWQLFPTKKAEEIDNSSVSFDKSSIPTTIDFPKSGKYPLPFTFKKGNVSIDSSVILSVEDVSSEILVSFLDEGGNRLHDVVKVPGIVGSTTDLTKEKNVQDAINKVIGSSYVLNKSPENETSIRISETTLEVQYTFTGVLKFNSVPNSLDFGKIKYDATTKRVENPTLDNELVVTDTRANTANGWQLTASLSTPMRNAKGQELVNALRYVSKGKETTLNENAQIVYEKKEGTTGSYTVSNNWGTTANTDGIKLQINSSDTVYTGDYVGVITWKVMAGQP